MDTPEPKRTKADSGAVVTEDQARQWAAQATATGQPRLRILTGDRTTGKLHLGHYVGSLKHRVAYQALYDTFILMADVQALTTHYDRPEVLRESVREVALDYMAAGIDPNQATICVQSMIPAIAELTVYYGLLVPVRSLIDNPTTKAEAEQHGFAFDDPSSHESERVQLAASDAKSFAANLGSQLQAEFPELGEIDELEVITAHVSVPLSDPVLSGHQSEEDKQAYIRKLMRDNIITSRRRRGLSAITYGFLGYPISQAADITFVGAHLVPVGPDQVPLIELCREVVHRFNHQYGAHGDATKQGSSGAGAPARHSSGDLEVAATGTREDAGTGARATESQLGSSILTPPFALLGVREVLQGIDGQAKMSKSLNNAIYLSETDAEIWAKVKPAPTDPQRVRKTDPGRPEMCNIFSYHSVFNGSKEPAIDEVALGVASVEEVAANCRGAKWGCIECKQHLCKKLGAILDPMRERRAQWETRPDDLEDILRQGTRRANEEGQQTLERVRSAMHMDYFRPQG